LGLAAKLADAAHFLSPANLETLEIWGHDTRNAVRFALQRAATQVTFVQEDRSRATLSLRVPNLPDLSELQALTAAGMQLDQLLPKRSLHDRDGEVMSGR
jgi:hypothetical protein